MSQPDRPPTIYANRPTTGEYAACAAMFLIGVGTSAFADISAVQHRVFDTPPALTAEIIAENVAGGLIVLQGLRRGIEKIQHDFWHTATEILDGLPAVNYGYLDAQFIREDLLTDETMRPGVERIYTIPGEVVAGAMAEGA